MMLSTAWSLIIIIVHNYSNNDSNKIKIMIDAFTTTVIVE